MATLIYEQAFAAGHSIFETNDVNDVNILGTDPLYPEIRTTHAIKVTLGAGPAGENVVEVDRSGVGNGANGGIWAELPTYPTDESIHIEEGYAEISWKFQQADLDEAVEAQLLHLFDYGTGGEVLSLVITDQFGPYEWRVRYPLWDGSGVNTINVTGLALVNQPLYIETWVTFRLAWKHSTVGDGYVRVTDETNGITIFEALNINFMFGWPVAPFAAERALITTYWLAYDGFAGQATNLRIYAGEPLDPAPIDTSTPCPCDPVPPTIGTIPNPIGTLPPWVAMCDTGCSVDSVADVSSGEVWL